MKKIVFVLMVALVLGCGGRKGFRPKLDPEERFASAKNLMERGKYVAAQEEFKRLIFEHPGSDYVDDAQYHLAECYFLNKEYHLAAFEYRFLIDNYGGSPYVDESYYKIGLSYFKLSGPFYLDQTNTHNAIDELELFLARFPESDYADDAARIRDECLEKLARKDFEAGKLYLRLRKYSAARVYFQSIADDHPEADISEESLYLIGVCYEKERDRENAIRTYKRVVSTSGDQELIRQAATRLEKLGE